MEEDIKLLLSYIETEVNEGRKPIMGGGVVVNGAQIISLLNRVRAALDAATGEDKVKEATQKANEIIQLAYERKQKIIDEDIATREAKAKAERIVAQAYAEKAKIETDLRNNLNYMLREAKQAVEEANASVKEAADRAAKSLDSAINRVNTKRD